MLAAEIPFWLVPRVPKLACPITRSGSTWVDWLNGLGKRRIRLFPESTTYRLPDLSTANPAGPVKPVENAPRPGPCGNVLNRSFWPMTLSAGAPSASAKAFFQARTRLLPESLTYKIGGEALVSMATEPGEFNSRPCTRLGARLLTLRPSSPITLDGLGFNVVWASKLLNGIKLATIVTMDAQGFIDLLRM